MDIDPNKSYIRTPHGYVSDQDLPVVYTESKLSMVMRTAIILTMVAILAIFLLKSIDNREPYEPVFTTKKMVGGNHIVVSFDERGAVAESITVKSPIKESILVEKPKLIDRKYELIFNRDIPIEKVFVQQQKGASSTGTVEIFDTSGNRTAVKRLRNSLFQSLVF
jgi:hypothetical protein